MKSNRIIFVFPFLVLLCIAVCGCTVDDNGIGYSEKEAEYYRVTQKPLLGDTLDYHLKVVKDYFRDSSVLVLDTKNNKFGFWKIGTKLIKLDSYTGFEFMEGGNNYIQARLWRDGNYQARPWKNGNILLIAKGFHYSPKDLMEIFAEPNQ